MTETALNERIAALQEIDASAVRQREKARYRLRRAIGIEKERCLAANHYISWWLYDTDDYIVETKDGSQKWDLREPEACMIISWKRTDWPESLSFSLREGQQYGIIHTRKATA